MSLYTKNDSEQKCSNCFWFYDWMLTFCILPEKNLKRNKCFGNFLNSISLLKYRIFYLPSYLTKLIRMSKLLFFSAQLNFVFSFSSNLKIRLCIHCASQTKLILILNVSSWKKKCKFFFFLLKYFPFHSLVQIFSQRKERTNSLSERVSSSRLVWHLCGKETKEKYI